MTHVLHIDASARASIRGQAPHGSHTRALGHRFVSRWQALHARHGDASATTLHHRDVGMQPPSPIDADWIASAFAPHATRSAAAHARLRESDTLIAELRAADVLVLGVPMYNFGPPAGFKAWIDNVVRVGETFGFDPQAADPYTPLLADRPRSVVLLTARGASGMGPGGPLAHANHLDGAVREVLVGLLGMRDWHSVAIEHDETGGEALAQSVAAAMQATDRLAAQLFERHRPACREPAVAL